MLQAFQDALGETYCWGCGSANPQGLHLKSTWEGEEAVCTFQPAPHHAAGPRHILNGGIIATLIDCHSVCTAIADAYRVEKRAMGTEPSIWYATASLEVKYLKPTPLEPGVPVELRARVVSRDGKKTKVGCSLFARGEERARGDVLAIRVSDAWRVG